MVQCTVHDTGHTAQHHSRLLGIVEKFIKSCTQRLLDREERKIKLSVFLFKQCNLWANGIKHSCFSNLAIRGIKRMTLPAHNLTHWSLFVCFLCSSLLPYLPMLMDPLVSALNGSQTLVSQVVHLTFSFYLTLAHIWLSDNYGNW